MNDIASISLTLTINIPRCEVVKAQAVSRSLNVR